MSSSVKLFHRFITRWEKKTVVEYYSGNDARQLNSNPGKVVPKLSDGTIFSDLEWRLTQGHDIT